MEHKLDIHQALRVVDKVTRYGEKKGEEYHFKGLVARPDFDGYTVVLKDDMTSLGIYFHNSYKLDFPDNVALEQFLERLQVMDQKDFKGE